jgi:hypothetical protein
VAEERQIVQRTPEEMRRFSNLGHVIEGSLIGVGSVLALKGALDGRQGGVRILASGDDTYLWGCGFSLPYSGENVSLFQAAFAP